MNETIKQLRISRGYNQVEFARILGVTKQCVSNWENEINKFTPELTYYIYHGSNRTYPLEEYDIIINNCIIKNTD